MKQDTGSHRTQIRSIFVGIRSDVPVANATSYTNIVQPPTKPGHRAGRR